MTSKPKHVHDIRAFRRGTWKFCLGLRYIHRNVKMSKIRNYKGKMRAHLESGGWVERISWTDGFDPWIVVVGSDATERVDGQRHHRLDRVQAASGFEIIENQG